jgi:MYND finger
MERLGQLVEKVTALCATKDHEAIDALVNGLSKELESVDECERDGAWQYLFAKSLFWRGAAALYRDDLESHASYLNDCVLHYRQYLESTNKKGETDEDENAKDEKDDDDEMNEKQWIEMATRSLVSSVQSRAQALSELDRPQECVKYLFGYVKWSGVQFGRASVAHVRLIGDTALALSAVGMIREAVAYVSEFMTWSERIDGLAAMPEHYAKVIREATSIYVQLKMWEEGVLFLRRAFPDAQRDKCLLLYAASRAPIANMQLQLRQYADAMASARAGYDVARQSVGTDVHPQLAELYASMADVCASTERADEAASLYARAALCADAGQDERADHFLNRYNMCDGIRCYLTTDAGQASYVDALNESSQTRRFAADAKRCGRCASDAAKLLCSGCRRVRYCAAECQQADWRYHRLSCKAIALDERQVNAMRRRCRHAKH